MRSMSGFVRSRWGMRGLRLAIAGLFAGGVMSAYLRQPATEVTVDQAVSRFRATAATIAGRVDAGGSDAAASAAAPQPAGVAAEQAAPGEAGAPGPGAAAAPARSAQAAGPAGERVQPGVYVYATEGYEYTDAVGGARHDYPKETAATVQPDACGGWLFRWQPLEERWDESELCPEPGGMSIRRFSAHHEFFRQRQQQDFLCPQGSLVFPNDHTPGHRWSLACRTSNAAIEMKNVVLGVEAFEVGGKTRDAVRIRYDALMTGGNEGRQVQERWIDRATGMQLQIKTDITTQAESPFGRVNYEEHYTIRLLSMTPRR